MTEHWLVDRLKRIEGEESGAVDLEECYWYHCRCGTCAICGYAKHTAIHGPCFGEKPGTKPYGHVFKPRPTAEVMNA